MAEKPSGSRKNMNQVEVSYQNLKGTEFKSNGHLFFWNLNRKIEKFFDLVSDEKSWSRFEASPFDLKNKFL